jgi:feruloyl esterase
VVKPTLAAMTCRGPKDDGCLSAVQVNSLVTLFDGATTTTGEAIYAPWAWDAGIGGKVGTAYNGGWRAWKIGAYGAPQNSGLNVVLGGAALAAVFVTPPSVAPSTGGGAAAYALKFDIDTYRRALSTPSGIYREPSLEFMRADVTDLSAFRRHGGKLMIAQGVSDPVFSILDTINWWNDVNRASGGASDFVRLFAVPGMNHCQGGPATDRFNAFGALVDWVERGTRPDRIVATAGPATPWPGRTRPLCAYPTIARYSGQGNLEDAASFVCR